MAAMTKRTFAQIRREAKAHFRNAQGSHGWDHTERVVELALHIGRREGADLAVLEVAACLHDIGRRTEDESMGELCHAEVGAAMAQRILAQHKLPPSFIEGVVRCIRHHRYRRGSRPDTLEAKILFDADKLDAIGAVGIGRAFLFAGEQGARLHNEPGVDPVKYRAYGREDTAYREFLVKLRHVRERMLTREGRKLAQRRHAFMLAFFKELQKETAGEG
jgi:uncharacterized protein